MYTVTYTIPNGEVYWLKQKREFGANWTTIKGFRGVFPTRGEAERRLDEWYAEGVDKQPHPYISINCEGPPVALEV